MRFSLAVLCLLSIYAVTPEAYSQPSSSTGTPKPQKQHKPDDTVGVVRGVLITYRDFRYQLKGILHEHFSEIKGDSVSGEDFTKFVNMAWDKMVSDVLVEQEIKKKKLTLTKQEVIKRLEANPPELISKSFTDSLGVVHAKEMKAFLENPAQDSLRDKVLLYYETSFEEEDFLKKLAPKAKTDDDRKKALDAWVAEVLKHTPLDDRRVAFGFY